ncbi:MAG: host factor-I protein [Caldanaerobacter sp.]|uniref:RNA chaperone Hfq n=1 Tax=Caldanaerobacter sp. TaxID=2930036 RepID=UPI0024AB32C4|nr:RNA chaperone Hfq [Caldanaerobacter sp.]MDI3519881.1 host factor-I protein [Caldanaerobacter sp.]MDK2821994.1 host factor-I protein [Clostridia bacterium]
MAIKKNTIKLQDVFLSQVRKEKVSVIIYLLRGIPLTGIIKGFDNYVVVLETEDSQEIKILKSAISSIVLTKPIIFM